MTISSVIHDSMRGRTCAVFFLDGVYFSSCVSGRNSKISPGWPWMAKINHEVARTLILVMLIYNLAIRHTQASNIKLRFGGESGQPLGMPLLML